MKRYICIHGHFYQPPRENPWLEAIEQQDSAYPYHDWNERITAECYAPNAASRIVNGKGYITDIVNNYSRISFNFGPTVLSWFQANAPDVYERILEADRESLKRFSGHGSALAQAYNHMIMPLANRRDKETQIIWGIRDFEQRFQRKPEGMWLPETAVDLETLDLMAEHGIQFTILSPYQAAKVRRKGGKRWEGVTGGEIDPTMAYQQALPSGRSITLFFYNGPISQAVAFERLLGSGEHFAHRLSSGFNEEREWPQLLHIATDGETYGHHHRFGDMALAYALQYIDSKRIVEITNYAEFLEKHPPTHEVQILENTAWSCAHGLGRWMENCGCNTGAHPEWNQEWRGPLRAALDWLRETLAPLYEQKAAEFFHVPWAARDGFIRVILNRSDGNLNGFLSQYASRPVGDEEKITVLKLLEMQRHAMLMYTSCGWFFDELSGIETVQVIQYAGRAVQLGQELFQTELEEPFLQRLEAAESNLVEHENGRRIYDKLVKPAFVDLNRVAAHFAVTSLFEPHSKRNRIYCYAVDREDFQEEESGKARLIVARALITSEITRESGRLGFGALYFAEGNLHGAVRLTKEKEAYQAMSREIITPFKKADLTGTIRALDKHFGTSTYSLKSLFRDEQRKIVDKIMESNLAELENEYRRIHNQYSFMIRLMGDLNIPLPQAFRLPGEFVLNRDLKLAFHEEDFDLKRVHALLEEAREERLDLDAAGLEFVLRGSLENLATALSAHPENLTLLQKVEATAKIARSLPFEVNLRQPQNLYWNMLNGVYFRIREKAESGDPQAQKWIGHFVSLGDQLAIAIPVAQEA